MTVHVSQTPGGAGASFSKVGLRSPSQMRKCGRRVGRAGVGGTGHGFWCHGLNHVGSKSRPKPEAYASQLGCTLDLNPVEVQGHGVLKVQQQTECRTCPVEQWESVPSGLLGPKVFQVHWHHPHSPGWWGALGIKLGTFNTLVPDCCSSLT